MEYTVNELLEQRKNILQELDDVWDVIYCDYDYGCGGGSGVEYEQSLLDELYDVEAELKLHGVNF